MDLWNWFQSQSPNNQMTMIVVGTVVVGFVGWQLVSFLRHIFDSFVNRSGDEKAFLKEILGSIHKEGEESRKFVRLLTEHAEVLAEEFSKLNKNVMLIFEFFKVKIESKDRDAITQLLAQLPNFVHRGEGNNENYVVGGAIRKP